MKRDGYESDKQDIIVDGPAGRINLTAAWDGTVSDYEWSKDGKKIFFTAAIDGTIQLFEVDYPGRTRKQPVVKKITDGDFDITAIVGQVGNEMVVTRTDMNHAAELFVVNLKDGGMSQLTHVYIKHYDNVATSKIERRYVTSTDGKRMVVCVIFLPECHPPKNYPPLLYCQGGTHSILTHYYS